MDIRQLHYFREIVNQESISKAAEVLHIAQPPLSQQLKKMETELGTVLIHRYRQKWELTETGEVLFQYAERLLSTMEDIKQQIEEIEQGSAGTLKIGVSSACLSLLVDYVSMYREKFPNVKISIEKGNSEELLRKLNRKEIEIALLLRLDHSEDYFVKALEKQEYVVVSPREWGNVFSSDQVTFKEIGNHPFIMLGAMEGHSYYENILRAFDAEDVTPEIVLESKDLTTVIAMVSKGLGLSIIPRVAYAVPMEQVKIYELKQFDFRVEPVLIKTKEERVSKAASQFWELVDSLFEDKGQRN
ncbi:MULTISPECIES: LysR family transcriptional regulator [unclassified Sporosarcina]|uniref:LysR family transcriptional regulator n=1 Tax=unclassified Sporosarcina TaxID=2647733 RepID=UPI00203B1B60|nr:MULTISPECIES: LysR family transcriptional regulator [unclassified Sporosarcina]GKV65322.1 HTH-type transcriptional regulator BsdA [Sporosarcina sp. NCCP-2331]GLB55446.1 HTH-type transcriptional regulator BsdA [Sporosarcina sp. NCCP-2378]